MMECTNPGLFSAGPDWLDAGEQRRHEALWQVARGRAEGEGGALRRHVGECRACARMVENFRRLDGALAEGATLFAACPSAKDLSDYHYYELPVEARVDVVEFLGNELQLILAADSQTFVARVGTDTQTRPGQTLRVGFNLRKLHVFDKQTEAALR